ncbi:MAG TPA: YceI family protein [Gemmataceae bacterium]|nr:YceI family protein [Gemmataceae bacterium]
MRKVLGTLGVAALAAVLGCSGGNSTAPTGQVSPSPSSATNSAKPAATDQGGKAPTATGAGAITPENSKIEFVGTKNDGKGANKHDGGFKKFSGSVMPIDGDITKATINVEIDVASMWTNADPKLGTHLQSPDFFDVKQFPTAKFVSKEIKAEKKDDTNYVISGDLTLHGVTKPVSIPAKITTADDGVTIDGKCIIDRREFDFGKKFAAPAVNNDITIKVVAKVARK